MDGAIIIWDEEYRQFQFQFQLEAEDGEAVKTGRLEIKTDPLNAAALMPRSRGK